MKIKKLMRCLLSMAFLLMAFAPVAYGDLYWESVQVRSGSPKGLPKDLQKKLPQGMPKDMPKPPPRPGMGHTGDRSQTIKHYLSEVGSRIDTPHDITIVLFKDMMIYQLDPSTRTYVKINMKEMEKNMDPISKMDKETKVTATGEKKTIEGFKCKKYILTIMGIENVQWLSKAVPGYDEYENISGKIMKNSPQFRRMGFSGKVSGKGFPVKMVSSVMGMTTTTTLKKIEKTTLNKDLFKVPEGYVQKPLNIPFHR